MKDLESIKGTIAVRLEEVSQDVAAYQAALARFEAATDPYEDDAFCELWQALSDLSIKALGTSECFDDYTQALPDDKDEAVPA